MIRPGSATDETRRTAPSARVRPDSPLLSVLAMALIVGLMATTLAAGYLSSWLPAIAGFPVGAELRDVLAAALIALAIAVERFGARPLDGRSTSARVLLVPLLLLTVWSVVLVPVSPSLTASILSIRNLVLFIAVAVAVGVLWRRGVVSGQGLVWAFLALGTISALLGLADTLTGGQLVTSLGFRRDFASTPGGAPRVISGVAGAVGGIVRASGGISDALVFGYLMALTALTGVWWAATLRSRSASRTLVALALAAAALGAAAMVESLTRGAWAALAVGLVVLFAVRPRATVAVLGAAAMAGALVVVVATSPLVPIVTADPVSGAITTAPGGSGGAGPVIVSRAGSDDAASQLSSQARVDQLRAGLKSLGAHPLGTGLGTEGAGADRAGAAAIKATPDIYLMIVALQTGVPGILLWLLIPALALVWLGRHRRLPGFELGVGAVALLAVASVLSHTPDAPPFSLFLWLVIAGLGTFAAVELGPGDDRAAGVAGA